MQDFVIVHWLQKLQLDNYRAKNQMQDTIDKIANKIAANTNKIEEIKKAVGDFFDKCRQEGTETVCLMETLSKQLNGEPVDQNELDKAKEQAVDLLRIVGIGLPQLIPLPLVGTASLLIILKLGKIFDINVLPSAWKK